MEGQDMFIVMSITGTDIAYQVRFDPEIIKRMLARVPGCWSNEQRYRQPCSYLLEEMRSTLDLMLRQLNEKTT